MQKFVSQPSEDGRFEVCRWVELKENYIPIKGEVYLTEEKSIERARELNEETKKEEDKA